MRSLIIQGGKLTDSIHEIEIPECGGLIMHNVTRAMFDIVHGRFGEPIWETFPEKNWMNEANLDMKKVRDMMKREDLVNDPAIKVGIMRSDGKIHTVFIDGNHRMAARQLAGFADYSFYFIPPDIEGEYRVTMQVRNGS